MNIDNGFYLLRRIGNTIELFGPWAVEYKTSTFNKVFRTSISYFLIDKPFIDFTPMTEPSNEKIEGLYFYQLRLQDGSLR